MSEVFDQDRGETGRAARSLGPAAGSGRPTSPGDSATLPVGESVDAAAYRARRLVAAALLLTVLAAAFWLVAAVAKADRESASLQLASSTTLFFICLVPLWLGARGLTSLPRERRRRQAIRIPATVVRIDRRGRKGTHGYREHPVLRVRPPGSGELELTSSIYRRGMRARQVTQAWVDPADPEWAAVATIDWRERVGDAAMTAFALVALASALWDGMHKLGVGLPAFEPQAWAGGREAWSALVVWAAAGATTVLVLVAVASAARELRLRHEARARAIEVPALAVAVTENLRPAQRPATLEYRTRDGVLHTAELATLVSLPRADRLSLQAGSTVRVQYDPHDPDVLLSIALSPLQEWLQLAAIALLGCGFAGALWWAAITGGG